MKKSYESPKAEKTTFNYNDTVVASDGCRMRTILDDNYTSTSYCKGVVVDTIYTDKH